MRILSLSLYLYFPPEVTKLIRYLISLVSKDVAAQMIDFLFFDFFSGVMTQIKGIDYE